MVVLAGISSEAGDTVGARHPASRISRPDAEKSVLSEGGGTDPSKGRVKAEPGGHVDAAGVDDRKRRVMHEPGAAFLHSNIKGLAEQLQAIGLVGSCRGTCKQSRGETDSEESVH